MYKIKSRSKVDIDTVCALNGLGDKFRLIVFIDVSAKKTFHVGRLYID